MDELNEDYLFDDETGGQQNNNENQSAKPSFMGNGIMNNDDQQQTSGNNNNNNNNNNNGGQSNEDELFNRINEGLNGVHREDGNNSNNTDKNGFGSYGNLIVNDNDDFATAILKQNGINPNAVPVYDENGNETSVSFSDLSRQEQIDIMSSIGNHNDYDLDDSEIDIINDIRRSGLTPEQWMDSFRSRIINEYRQSGGDEPVYEVDSLSDEELWLSDYKSKVKDATEDEALSALRNAQQNPQLFEKTMNGMRAAYKEQEEQYNNQLLEQRQREAQERAEQYESAIVNAVNSNSNVRFGDFGLKLSNDDKEDIASFILDKDSSGVRYMLSAMSNTDELVKMAFMYLKGPEIIDEMQKDYKKQIADARNSSYNKGYNDAKSGKGMSFTVRRPSMQTGRETIKKIATIDDLDNEIL